MKLINDSVIYDASKQIRLYISTTLKYTCRLSSTHTTLKQRHIDVVTTQPETTSYRRRCDTALKQRHIDVDATQH